MGFDWAVFKLINSLAGRSPLLDTIIRLLMNDYGLSTLLVLVPFGLWFSGDSPDDRERNQRGVLSTVVALVLGNLVVKAINLVYWRWRPFTYHEVTLLFYHPSDSSFPSNAATVGFCIAVSVWLFNRRAGLLLFVLASLFSVSRIAGGVHYPMDIVGGFCIGGLAAWLVGRKFRFLNRLWTPLIERMRWLVLA